MLTTVVGNYPKIGSRTKTPNLRTAIANHDDGKLSADELHQIEDQVTIEVLQEQAETGVDLLTDGQIRWDDPFTYVARSLGGFEIDGLTRYFDTNTYFRQPVVVGKIHWEQPVTVRDFQFAVANSPRPVKAVLPGPYTLARLSKGESLKPLENLVVEAAEALNHEAQALERAGASIIQFDEPAILKYPQDFPLFRQSIARLTQGLRAKLALYVYFKDLGVLYPEFLKMPFHVFGLDFVMGKANFTIVRSFPSDKELGFGIVDARNTRKETEQELIEALRNIVQLVPADRLVVSPNCGLEFLPRQSAYDKLVGMVKGAKKALEVLG
ncbi:MAG: methylcobamide--CoM methyltransferase [Chloroflexi bacterium]|nr:methylcobamide--CoM methyltransferase [Chloroflexota bacterium]